MSEKKQKAVKRFLGAVREFIQGAVFREPALVIKKQKASLEQLFLLVFFADTLGIPVLHSYYSLRLLPYMVPRLEPWKRGVLRQRDWTDWALD
jgi:hypothetical protein